jgi:uncharacterized membrane protein YesL
MNGIFSIDGPLYKIGNIIYYLLVGNLLWFVFSLPTLFLTAGASTTALFYIMGKVVRGEDISVFKDFWKSFKTNFKQATIIWLVMLVAYFIIFTNIRNMYLLGNMAKYMYPLQIALLIEFLIITVYTFPILSRYDMATKNVIKSAFYMGNRHIFTTILCIGTVVGVGYLLYNMPGLFILMPVSLSALGSYYLIHNVFQKYLPDEKIEVVNDDATFSIK